jgi:hypothetical protein
MKADITKVIANTLLNEPEADLFSRLNDQEEALGDSECIFPLIGSWMEQFGADHLLSIFSLDDICFAKRFPQMAQITARERKLMRSMFEEHLEHCSHCWLRRGFDLDLNSQIDRSLRRNKNVLLKLMTDDTCEELSEGEHPRNKASCAAPPVVPVKPTSTESRHAEWISLVEDFQEP